MDVVIDIQRNGLFNYSKNYCGGEFLNETYFLISWRVVLKTSGLSSWPSKSKKSPFASTIFFKTKSGFVELFGFGQDLSIATSS